MAGSVYSDVVTELLSDHFRHLNESSGISVGVIKERGYRSILGKSELQKIGYTPAQQRAPGILIPLWSVDGKEAGFQYRPDHPRTSGRGKAIKYESPAGSSNRLDCPPRCHEMLGNPQVPLWITEGSKKADALASKGACAISVTGVWGFKGKNQFGGVTFLTDWDYIALKGRAVYLAFDSDVVTKEMVRKALLHIGEHLRRKGASVHVIQLPQFEAQDKTGIDDYLLRYSLQDAERLAGTFKLEETEDKNRFVSGFVLHDGTVGEMIVSSDDDRSFMIVINGVTFRRNKKVLTSLPGVAGRLRGDNIPLCLTDLGIRVCPFHSLSPCHRRLGYRQDQVSAGGGRRLFPPYLCLGSNHAGAHLPDTGAVPGNAGAG